ncbi:probable plastid-lipid-associated protein 4, chloroplastic [Spinacia oleracea]|uniref:Probable plastid-lipid-associated protein 4, chloroplastic n=1 Tax=Spinacia oleracea TaxID=3562 RepID=A0A9R0JHH5_SPIOL|nr:probable plastid-lipid-associated protein 4, chloroplastic [Spinacia oleracea]
MASSSTSLSKIIPANDPTTILPVFHPSVPSTLHFPSKPHLANKPHPAGDCKRTRISSKTRVSFISSFFTKNNDSKTIKDELLEAIVPLDKGADANPEDQQRIDQLTRKLEAVNPTKEPLKSDLLNGKWELIYTTSKSILQTERPKFLRSRVNYQAINLDTLRAQNMETWPFFNQVTADLLPKNSREVSVKFDYFKILGLIPVKAPERTQYGSLYITYLDEDFRVSRGDKGNLFILRMVDRSYIHSYTVPS